MKTTSRFALVAAAGLMMGSVAMSSVKAADLGGDCCADLEERVAELEATTVRKGNRKVSLEISGQVNKGLLAWDDGKKSDAYVEDDEYSSTRFRFKGTGQMMPGWKAGFYMEYEFRDSGSQTNDQTNAFNRDIEGGNTRSVASAFRIRVSNVFVESEKYGRVTIGQLYQASKDIEVINLGGGLQDAENYYAESFKIRDNALGAQTLGVTNLNATLTTTNQAGVTTQPAAPNKGTGVLLNSSAINWSALSSTFDPGRIQAVRYDTPSIYGFIASASWGENDFWDVALRYQKEWNSIRIAAGIGYYWSGDNIGRTTSGAEGDGSQFYNNGGSYIAGLDGVANNRQNKYEVVKGSVSVMHVPTGLYASFMAGERLIDGVTPGQFDGSNTATKDSQFYYIQAGITKRFFDVGATTFFGEYGEYHNEGTGALYGNLNNGTNPFNGTGLRIASDDVTRYGAGFTQAFDGAALELYSNYVHYEADITAHTVGTGIAIKTAPQDFDAVFTGARIKF